MSDTEVIRELERIAGEHQGLLRPSDVVKAARPVSSPLHEQFEWDNDKCGEEYRLWQARKLISVTVEYIGEGDEAVPFRVFVSLTPDRKHEGGGYRLMRITMADGASRKQLFADALAEMKRFQQKYQDLKELAGVFAAMRKVSSKKKQKAAA